MSGGKQPCRGVRWRVASADCKNAEGGQRQTSPGKGRAGAPSAACRCVAVGSCLIRHPALLPGMIPTASRLRLRPASVY